MQNGSYRPDIGDKREGEAAQMFAAVERADWIFVRVSFWASTSGCYFLYG